MVDTQIDYRQADKADIQNLIELERKVWGQEMAAGEDKWLARFSKFPNGILVARQNGTIAGVIVINVIKWTYSSGVYPTWEEATGNGLLTNFDGQFGDAMYGVDLTVRPGSSPKIAGRLLRMAIKYTRDRNLKKGFLGSRIPSLRSYIKKNHVNILDESLVMLVAARDVEVRFFCRTGFKLIGVKKDYFPLDEDSLGWGAILELI